MSNEVAVMSSKEVVTVPEWCHIVNVKESLGYDLSRKNAIPGMFRINKFVRIHLPTFYAEKGIPAYTGTPRS